MTTNSPYAGLEDPAKYWLMRVVTLAVIVGGWLLNAHDTENRRVADELRARGRTTTAQDPYKDPFDRWRERSQVSFSPTRAYLYVIDGVEYRHTTTKSEFDPVGKTVTYLPEDPNVHQVGDIVPAAGMPWWGYGVFLILALAFGGLTVAFFLFALLPPGEPEPTRIGGWCIVILAAIQFTIALVTTSFFRVPFHILLALGVPLFVGGTVLAVAGVRLLAWGRGIALRKPAPRPMFGEARPPARKSIRPSRTATTSPPLERPAPAAVISPNSVIACPICSAIFAGSPDERAMVTCPNGHRFAPGRAEAPKPTQFYYVTREPGRDFVGMHTWNEIRAQLATGELQASFYATESDGRSFRQFQRGNSGRWRTLAELLAERGETPPPLVPAAARLPWHATPRAALAGAVGCLLLAMAGFLCLHAAAFLCRLAGASWSWVGFFTSAESILMDLILGSIAAAFGAIRGVVHHSERQGGDLRTYGEIAQMAASDLASIRNPSGSLEGVFERIACLMLAAVLASPVIVILLLVWFRS